MQGTSAFIEYIKPKDEFKRDKRRCEFYRSDSLCGCPKAGTYMCKCNTAAYCRYYRQKDFYSKKNKDSTKKKQPEKVYQSKEFVSYNKISKHCKVKLQDYQFNERLQITLVDLNESDPINNKISIQSPLGSALLNKQKGDKIMITVGEEKRYYKILSWSKL